VHRLVEERCWTLSATEALQLQRTTAQLLSEWMANHTCGISLPNLCRATLRANWGRSSGHHMGAWTDKVLYTWQLLVATDHKPLINFGTSVLFILLGKRRKRLYINHLGPTYWRDIERRDTLSSPGSSTDFQRHTVAQPPQQFHTGSTNTVYMSQTVSLSTTIA